MGAYFWRVQVAACTAVSGTTPVVQRVLTRFDAATVSEKMRVRGWRGRPKVYNAPREAKTSMKKKKKRKKTKERKKRKRIRFLAARLVEYWFPEKGSSGALSENTIARASLSIKTRIFINILLFCCLPPFVLAPCAAAADRAHRRRPRRCARLIIFNACVVCEPRISPPTIYTGCPENSPFSSLQRVCTYVGGVVVD